MIKLLHSADWHLDACMTFRDPTQAGLLRKYMQALPDWIATLCRQEHCDLVLLSGDIFDAEPAGDTLAALKKALSDCAVPVFISPGNHDHLCDDSFWLTPDWPENVHIFTHPVLEAVDIPQLDCCVYGAGFLQMDCPSLLTDFFPLHTERYGLCVVHGDPTQLTSAYNPVTKPQVEASGLDYIALGHIHKAGAFRAGKTLCAWPGCPMGRGFDETGEKGVSIVTLDGNVQTRFVPYPAPRFYDLTLDAEESLDTVLPPLGNQDFYRITLTGEADSIDLEALSAQYPQFPNLDLRDKTSPPTDLWGNAGMDTFEGTYFQLLRSAMENADPEDAELIRLAAKISRKLLNDQEVVLP